MSDLWHTSCSIIPHHMQSFSQVSAHCTLQLSLDHVMYLIISCTCCGALGVEPEPALIHDIFSDLWTSQVERRLGVLYSTGTSSMIHEIRCTHGEEIMT